MPFRVIVAVMENFSRTRKRIRDFVSQPRIASTLKFGMMLTLAGVVSDCAAHHGSEGDQGVRTLETMKQRIS